MRFSPSTRGWYPENVHYADPPDDLINVPDELFAELRNKQLDHELGPDGMPRLLVPGLSIEQRAALLLSGVDEHLNAAARAKGYDDIRSAALRAALPASPFHDEGVAFGNWMDQVYATCYQLMAQVQAGTLPEPDLEQLLQMLPALELPA